MNSLKLWFADLLHDVAWALERQAIAETLATALRCSKATAMEKLTKWLSFLPPDEQRRISSHHKRQRRRAKPAAGGPLDERRIH